MYFYITISLRTPIDSNCTRHGDDKHVFLTQI